MKAMRIKSHSVHYIMKNTLPYMPRFIILYKRTPAVFVIVTAPLNRI